MQCPRLRVGLVRTPSPPEMANAPPGARYTMVEVPFRGRLGDVAEACKDLGRQGFLPSIAWALSLFVKRRPKEPRE